MFLSSSRRTLVDGFICLVFVFHALLKRSIRPSSNALGIILETWKWNSGGIVYALFDEQWAKCPFVLHVELSNKVCFCTETQIMRKVAISAPVLDPSRKMITANCVTLIDWLEFFYYKTSRVWIHVGFHNFISFLILSGREFVF